MCGGQLFSDLEEGESHPLEGVVMLKQALVCGMPVEKNYFTCAKFPEICCWCATTDAAEFVDLTTKELRGKRGDPMCVSCDQAGLAVVTWGAADKTSRRGATKYKGRKRRKVLADDDSDKEISDNESGAKCSSEEDSSEPDKGCTGEAHNEDAEMVPVICLDKVLTTLLSGCIFGQYCIAAGSASAGWMNCVMCNGAMHVQCRSQNQNSDDPLWADALRALANSPGCILCSLHCMITEKNG
jgi:hypothetical protein